MCQRDSPKQSSDMKVEKTKPKVSESRKIRKPLMEKKRRARINDCLNELKRMLLDTDAELKQSGSRPAKLEKADILEMTVRHVRRLQCATRDLSLDGPVEKFNTGFSECVGEVHSELGRMENVDPLLKERLGSHLGSCLSKIRRDSTAEDPSSVVSSSSPSPPPTPTPVQREGSFTLVPTKLPNGDLAFVIPAEMQVLKQNGNNRLVLKSQIVSSEPLWRPW